MTGQNVKIQYDQVKLKKCTQKVLSYYKINIVLRLKSENKLAKATENYCQIIHKIIDNLFFKSAETRHFKIKSHLWYKYQNNVT